jgi:hypothetical protein
VYSGSIRNKALHDFTLTNMIVARFLVVGGFLIRYSNGLTK